MIAVKTGDSEKDVVREFFELFKTPWEFCREGSTYDVLICSRGPLPENSARLILIYGSEQNDFDRQNRLKLLSSNLNRILSFGDRRLPIAGKCLAFAGSDRLQLLDESTSESVAIEIASPERTIIRLGFDLFEEIRFLITDGQPIEHAAIPTLDLHIALLRELILSHSIPFVEIPPVPAGYHFIACLTHDVDHAAIRKHTFDHTMFGFLYRATIGALISFCRGRRSLRQLAANWLAAFSLPLVHLGLVKDFWKRFDRYLDLEKEPISTFFIIPRKRDPGSQAPARRATRYDVDDVTDQIDRLTLAGCEIACHGIDAWHDAIKGRKELEKIRSAARSSQIGVRSHWLYSDEHSPAAFERAGFDYDSTVGYNETVGYRAGTSVTFRPLNATRLLELPMQIMDTALFYPDRMDLSEDQAKQAIQPLLKNANRFGGALTINWHDRSIAPERLWGDFYTELVDDVKDAGAWFARCEDAVAWFRRRRSARIDKMTFEEGSLRVRISVGEASRDLPGLRLRLHQTRANFIDIEFGESGEIEFPSRA